MKFPINGISYQSYRAGLRYIVCCQPLSKPSKTERDREGTSKKNWMGFQIQSGLIHFKPQKILIKKRV